MLALAASTAAFLAPSAGLAATCNQRNAPIVCSMGRREWLSIGAAGAALSFVDAAVADYGAAAGPRPANQDAIGVSRVEVAPMGQGAPGAGIKPVAISQGYKNKECVFCGDKGAEGNAGPEGFFGGGEKFAKKQAVNKREKQAIVAPPAPAKEPEKPAEEKKA